MQPVFPRVMVAATCSATTLEKRRQFAVDALVPEPIFVSTHAITIDAPPEQVWPQDRAVRREDTGRRMNDGHR